MLKSLGKEQRFCYYKNENETDTEKTLNYSIPTYIEYIMTKYCFKIRLGFGLTIYDELSNAYSHICSPCVPSSSFISHISIEENVFKKDIISLILGSVIICKHTGEHRQLSIKKVIVNLKIFVNQFSLISEILIDKRKKI